MRPRPDHHPDRARSAARAAACWPSGWSRRRARCGYRGAEHLDPRRRAAHRRHHLLRRDLPAADRGARRPQAGVQPATRCPARIDLLVVAPNCSKPVRQIGRRHGQRRSARMLVTSTSRTLTTAEKMQLADGRFDAAALLAVRAAHSRALDGVRHGALARDAGTVISAVMFGAIAGQRRAAVRARGLRGGDPRSPARASRRACAASRAASTRCSTARAARDGAAPRGRPAAAAADAAPRRRCRRLARRFPPRRTTSLRARPRARASSTRTRAYAELYSQRLQRVLAAERARPTPRGARLR